MTASGAILRGLAAENRRVLSDWRAAVLLRRATLTIDRGNRRWSDAPESVESVWPILRQMEKRGELQCIPRLRHVYVVTVPYVNTGLIDENEILMEVQPYAALSHLSALFYHDLTLDLPKQITAMVPTRKLGGLLPLDTESSDWEGLLIVRGTLPDRIQNLPIRWTQVIPNRYFGVREYRPQGYPIRVTDIERTLLDGLLNPEFSGGLDKVLRAWAGSRDMLDLPRLVDYTNLFDIGVLRQRVGFIVDQLAIHHPDIEAWRARAHRGGSSKLLGSAPYSPTYSERWNLSINAPISALEESTT